MFGFLVDYFDDINFVLQQNSFKSSENILRSDNHQFNIIKGAIQNLKNILSKFNSDVDTVFEHLNDTNDAGQPNVFAADEKIQNIVNNKCQITHIVDADACLCYVIDLDG